MPSASSSSEAQGSRSSASHNAILNVQQLLQGIDLLHVPDDAPSTSNPTPDSAAIPAAATAPLADIMIRVSGLMAQAAVSGHTDYLSLARQLEQSRTDLKTAHNSHQASAAAQANQLAEKQLRITELEQELKIAKNETAQTAQLLQQQRDKEAANDSAHQQTLAQMKQDHRRQLDSASVARDKLQKRIDAYKTRAERAESAHNALLDALQTTTAGRQRFETQRAGDGSSPPNSPARSRRPTSGSASRPPSTTTDRA